ncbi:sugar porter family MFS transporter [Sinomicrobium kalidii]|uniref:sugar porter family MFS transporter n=1 Tax=Sinomicrobium kalidii TaxID=2900738 RepID=UPI001E35A16E|nr:sugar porter family MFS transporter [Sinomicrobium kalidii]UGU14926.1 sugar porter family MFS transporter [Sinomicrobium kalidii]
MNKIVFWSVTAALAGFLFGFDTVVISGADRQLQLLWNSSDAFHGSVVMAMALWGTVIGALFGGIPTNRIGRKNTLLLIGGLYLVSSLGSALANDPYTFAFFRFIGGLGVGASTIAAPAYVSEIAPAGKRGRLVSLYQFNIVLGILIAFVSNYLLSDIGPRSWRWMMGVEALPALVYLIFAFNLPQSPRWLISKNRIESAKAVLKLINPAKNTEHLIEKIRTGSGTAQSGETIFMKKYRFPLILAFLIALFNQLSGINAFLYYAPRIFEEAGLAQNTALLSSVGIGVVNLLFTLLGVMLIDRLGRKTLMLYGSFGYILSLSMVTAAFYFDWGGISVPLSLFVFIASHAVGQGAVIWVYISEIFPNHLRPAGQAFGSSVHWILAAVIPSLIPMLFGAVGAWPVFLFFTVMMALQLLFVWFVMPETKGISLEDIQARLKISGSRSEVKSQKSKVRSLKPEVRSRKFEVPEDRVIRELNE